MNIYDVIKKKYLSGEMSEWDVRRCAKGGMITAVEAETIIGLKPRENNNEE